MTPEIISIIAVGVALAGVVLISVRENTRVLRAEMKDIRAEVKDVRGEMKDVRGEMKDMRVEMAELRERLARIEGMFEGFLRRDVEPALRRRRPSKGALSGASGARVPRPARFFSPRGARTGAPPRSFGIGS